MQNDFHVRFFEKHRLACALAAGLLAGLPAIHDNYAVGKGAAESNEDGVIETVSISHQQDHGYDSPRDTKHRHRRSKPMVDERRYRLQQNFLQDHE